MTRERETMEYAATMRRMLDGWIKRLEDADVEDVAELVAFAPEVNDALGAVVLAMREAGRPWAEVGRAFGTTRQAARQRWGYLER